MCGRYFCKTAILFLKMEIYEKESPNKPQGKDRERYGSGTARLQGRNTSVGWSGVIVQKGK
jgi:hypothetical protein